MGSAKIYIIYFVLSTLVISSLNSLQYVSRRVYRTAADLMGVNIPNRYKTQELRFDRTNWDEISILLTVTEKATGKNVDVLPVPSFEVYTADNKIIMEGIGYDILIPDNQLGPEEPYTIRVSTVIEGERIVATKQFNASPKTIVTDLDLNYPLNKNLVSGEYNFNYKIFRADFTDAQYYEPINVSDVKAELVANKGTSREISINLSKGKNTFKLDENTNYNNYKQYVLTNITEGTSATVTFTPVVHWANTQEECDGKQVAISMEGVEGNEMYAQKVKPAKAVIIPDVITPQLATIKQEVYTPKQQAIIPPVQPERAAGNVNEISNYAQKAANKIMHKYDAQVAAGCKATIKTWKYDPFMGQYTATITTTWYNKYMPEETYRVEGTLTVTKDGNTSKFNRTAVNQTIADIEKYNGTKLKASEQLASLN